MKTVFITCVAALTLATAPKCLAKDKKYAPLPPELLSAKTVVLTGGPQYVLDKAYTELKKWGRFQVVSDAAHADLVFNFTYEMAHGATSTAVHGTFSETLVITDAKTAVSYYEDGRLASPGGNGSPAATMVSVFHHSSMARDMVRDLRKRIEATEKLVKQQANKAKGSDNNAAREQEAAAQPQAAASPAQTKQEVPCKVYFIIMENDSRTENKAMIGFTHRQKQWWESNRSNFSGICPVNVEAGGEQVFNDPDALTDRIGSIVLKQGKDVPIYEVSWALEFAPSGKVYTETDTNRLAVGTIYRLQNTWNELSSVFSTNRWDNPDIACAGSADKCDPSIYSFSTSLLRNALEKIRGWEEQRLAAPPL